MRKLLLFLLLVASSSVMYAMNKRLQAILTYSSFLSPEHGSYFETYLAVDGNSVYFNKNASGKFQAIIQITMIFKQNNVIKDFKKYELYSTELDDTTNIKYSFIDQQRFVLPNGKYQFEISISDKFSEKPPYKTEEEIIIDFPEDKISISGIQLIESFKKSTTTSIITKSGLDLVPYVSDYYPEKVDKIIFYAEIYNAEKILGKNENFLITTYIEAFENSKKISNLVRNKREQSKTVNVVFGEFSILQLPSGNFNLVVEIRDKTNQLVAANRIFFQRSNPKIQYDIKDIAALNVEETFAGRIIDLNEITDIIKSLSPISSELERNFIYQRTKTADLKLLQQFFFNFWLQRNNSDPERAWLAYKEKVVLVNNKFGTRVKKGYETDRGRVYLEYGTPNEIVDRAFEASKGLNDEGWGSVPYQIWHYYKLNNQANKKFVFYNPNIASNDYELIHSDALGEINDPNWYQRLSRSNELYEDNQRNPGGKAGELFRNPR